MGNCGTFTFFVAFARVTIDAGSVLLCGQKKKTFTLLDVPRILHSEGNGGKRRIGKYVPLCGMRRRWPLIHIPFVQGGGEERRKGKGRKEAKNTFSFISFGGEGKPRGVYCMRQCVYVYSYGFLAFGRLLLISRRTNAYGGVTH